MGLLLPRKRQKAWEFKFEEFFFPFRMLFLFFLVTVDTHPGLGIPFAYVHPCKHAHVMKKFVERMIESGKTPRADQYLLLFLKVRGWKERREFRQSLLNRGGERGEEGEERREIEKGETRKEEWRGRRETELLQFLGAVIPTIAYDNTFEVGL
jgi:hypothetical protein